MLASKSPEGLWGRLNIRPPHHFNNIGTQKKCSTPLEVVGDVCVPSPHHPRIQILTHAVVALGDRNCREGGVLMNEKATSFIRDLRTIWALGFGEGKCMDCTALTRHPVC